MTFSVVPFRKKWYMFSGVLMLLSVVSLFVWGLSLGIDFTGGSLLEVRFAERPAIAEIRTAVEGVGFVAQVQESAGTDVIIRTSDLNEEKHQELIYFLKEKYQGVEELRFDSIGPVIGNELRKTATVCVVVTLILIGIYVAWAFKGVSKPVASWKYGFLTIVKAFHDTFIAIGAFALVGNFYHWEVGAGFVAAVLTILGYSINDVIVVFDRTRENLSHHVGETFEETVDLSIRQTLTRSLYTSVTILLSLVAVFFFGGDTTRSFAFALIAGISVATYSSVFIASPLLVTWEKWRAKRMGQIT